jgi:hypothetical protein
MSDDAPVTLPAINARDERLFRCLRTEILNYREQNPDSTSPLATVDLDSLESLSRRRVQSLRRMMLLDLLVAGTPPEEICDRLSLPIRLFPNLLHIVLRDDFAGDMDHLRTLSSKRLEWLWEQARRMVKDHPTPQNLLAALAVDKTLNRLHGLNKPLKVEVEQTKQIGVVLRVIETREQLTHQSPPELALDVPPELPAEAATDVEAEDADASR